MPAAQGLAPGNTRSPRYPLSRREWAVRTAWALADAVVVAVATWGAAWLRYDFVFSRATAPLILSFVALAVVLWLLSGAMVGPYLVHHLRGSFEETAALGRAALLTVVALAAVVLVAETLYGVPRSLVLSAPLFSLLGMLALRLVVRSYRWGRSTSSNGRRAIVFGAGEGGRQLIRALVRDQPAAYVPVAILDDDPGKRRLRVDGVQVKGTRAELARVAEQTSANALIIAMPSADAELVGQLRGQAQALGLDVLVLPPVASLIDQKPQGADLREVNLEDLLGRRQVELDETAIAEVVTGKQVLVTGAGGSIGAELCRQIQRFGPAKLTLLDRDESALHSTQMSMTGRALLDDGTLALCDIRDLDSVREVFERERPQLVFHAAALKHLTLLEQFPLEAWKTNVLGTRNVLESAHAVGVETFVNISTDKAANPTCVLGYSKRVAERLTADFARRDTNRYVSVRFGNVLGSRGSVITAFAAQIERGGPVTVTHPDVERYFMLIPEACQLVLQASAIGKDGQVMVLDMGEPVKIMEVARTLIDLSGRKGVDIVYTGLRSGEKLSEELFAPGENIQPSLHPLVSYVQVPAVAPDTLPGAFGASPAVALAWMQREVVLTVGTSSSMSRTEFAR